MTVMITTTDNPFDPRIDFASWYAWDVQQGYNTCAYVARILNDTEDFPQAYSNRLVEMAIDEIIEMHAGDLYKKLKLE